MGRCLDTQLPWAPWRGAPDPRGSRWGRCAFAFCAQRPPLGKTQAVRGGARDFLASQSRSKFPESECLHPRDRKTIPIGPRTWTS